jgi:hypothetical protein
VQAHPARKASPVPTVGEGLVVRGILGQAKSEENAVKNLPMANVSRRLSS